jgi:hypothetical protein
VAATTTTTAASAIKTKFKEELLAIYQEKAIMAKLASKEKVEYGGGDTVRFNKLLRTAKTTTALTEGQISFTDSAFTSNMIEVEIAEWGHTWAVNKRVDLVSILKDSAYKKNIQDHILTTTEYQVMKAVAQGGMRHLIDGDATMMVSGTADSGSTVTLVDNALTQTDNHWGASAAAAGYATITNSTGANYDITSKVTDFVASTDTCTVSFPQAIGSTSKYRLVRGTNLVATDVLTLTGLMQIAAIHEHLRTPKFDDGLYRCVLDAAQKRDLFAADAIQKYVYYDRSEAVGKYHIFRLLDTEFIVSPEIYREDVDGTENQSTGVVYVAPIMGKDSFHIVHWGNGRGDFGLELVMIETPDSYNKLGMQRYFGWYAPFAEKVTRATANIGLMTGATDLGVLI